MWAGKLAKHDFHTPDDQSSFPRLHIKSCMWLNAYVIPSLIWRNGGRDRKFSLASSKHSA